VRTAALHCINRLTGGWPTQGHIVFPEAFDSYRNLPWEFVYWIIPCHRMQHRLVSYYNYLFGITELFCELAFIVTACLLLRPIKLWQFVFCTLRIFANALNSVPAGLCTALQYARVVFIKFQQRRSEFCGRVSQSTSGSTPQGGLQY